MSREIHTVNLEFTVHCNKRCPDCCAGVGINRTLQHQPWEYFEEAAKWIKGIHRIHLTGGEPTMHPKFAEFVPKLRDLFKCETLTMVTNGFLVSKYEDLIVDTFDWVNWSDYEDRRDALESLRRRMHVNVKHEGVNGALFMPRAVTGQGKPCTRAAWLSLGCAYADGKFWGCSVAPGLPEAVPLEPCADWKQKLLAAPLPCSTCFLSEA
jgi:hypothetical protein